jgi:hypothetical protein
MARKLGETNNSVLIRDNLSETDVRLFYRIPTTAERVSYSNESFRRKGGKIINQAVETRLKYGLKIVTGIRDGDFERSVDNRWLPISSDPNHPDYAKDWKEFLEKYASDLVQLLSLRVFEASAQIAEEPEPEEPDNGEDLDPNA